MGKCRGAVPTVTEDDTPDPDDEELPETPTDVVAMLGFDPREAQDPVKAND